MTSTSSRCEGPDTISEPTPISSVASVERQSRVSFGLGIACLAASALLRPPLLTASVAGMAAPALVIALGGIAAEILFQADPVKKQRALAGGNVAVAACAGALAVTSLGSRSLELIWLSPTIALMAIAGLAAVVWPLRVALSVLVTPRRPRSARASRGDWISYGLGFVIATATGVLAFVSINLASGQSVQTPTGCGPTSSQLATAHTTTGLCVLMTLILIGYLVFSAIPSGPRVTGRRRWNRGAVLISGVGLIACLPLVAYALLADFSATFCLTF